VNVKEGHEECTIGIQKGDSFEQKKKVGREALPGNFDSTAAEGQKNVPFKIVHGQDQVSSVQRRKDALSSDATIGNRTTRYQG